MNALATELEKRANMTAFSAPARTVLLLTILASLLTLVWTIEATVGLDRLGMRVVDVDSLRRWVETPNDQLAVFIASFQRAPGLYALYSRAAWGDGAGYHVLNLALLALAVIASQALFAPRSASQAWAAGLAVCCNPFLLLVSVGPNNEIPLTALLLAFFALPRRFAAIPVHLLIVVAAFLIKDGAGLFLFGWLGVELVTDGRRRWPLVVALMALVIVACSWRALESVHPAVMRISRYPDDVLTHMPDNVIARLSRDGLDHPVLGLAMFWVRYLANVFAAGFRAPVLTTRGDVTLYGVSLAMNGVVIGAATLSCVLRVCRAWREGRPPDAAAAFPIFYATAVAAGVLFVQSRYLIPTLPLALGSVAAPNGRFGRMLLVVAGVAIMMIAALEIGGKPLPQGDPTSPDVLEPLPQ